MTNKTRKRFWPVALMSLAVLGVLAMVVALSAVQPQATQAHECDSTTMTAEEFAACDRDHRAAGLDPNDPNHEHATATPPPEPPSPVEMGVITGMGSTSSSSTSGSSTVEIKLQIADLTHDVAVGGSIVLYLEDDYQEPDEISASDVFFVSEPAETVTGNGARVFTTVDPVIATSDYFTPDKKDISIQVFVPDMCRNATTECEGDNGLLAGDTITMVVTKSAGIKNPSEEGTHSTGFAVLPATHTGSVPGDFNGRDGDDEPMTLGVKEFTSVNTLGTARKITLSDVDNSRGYELTVTGSGFKNGTTAAVFVLNRAPDRVAWWNALNCREMVAAVGLTYDGVADSDEGMPKTDPMDSPNAAAYCVMYDGLMDTEEVKALSTVRKIGECKDIIDNGTNAGSGLVGSDDKVAVTFEVTVPTFAPGNVNHICMIDGTGKASYGDIEDFNLQPSIAVVPGTVNTGDTVNVFAQDFMNEGAGFSGLKIGGSVNAPNDEPLSSFITDREPISNGSGSVTFEVPGGLGGTLRIDAAWGDVEEDSTITIGGAELISSKTGVLPNETITITGNGFGTQTCIPFSHFKLDNVPLIVHDDSAAERCGTRTEKGVEVSNSGQFVATLILWPYGKDPASNPSLIPGTHKLSVVDTDDFEAEISLTIEEPTISVAPDVAGPRDYITVTGENWAVDNLDHSLSDPITVVIEDYQNGRTYPVYADSVGRFTVEHRVHRRVAIPDTVQVKANYDEGKVVKIGSFSVPASTITVTPGEGQPGDMVTLTAANMPVYTEADYVEIGGTTYQDPGVNTDRDGNITVEDVLIPGLDPGVYSVVINVDGTIAIGEVSVLAESSAAGAPAMLPGAVENLGDSLVAIFHFDDVGKVWSFYDPRPEFSELNTLTEMVNGEAYWILVSETVEDVVLNNKVRSLTCRGDDCWNLEVW